MKKFLKRAGGTLLALFILAVAGSWIWGQVSLAKPTAEALAALASDERVTVQEGDFLTFRPASGPVRAGVIFYPGANCDVRGYAPVLRRIAQQGYLVVDVAMPLNFAIYAPDRADAVREAFPDIQRWVIIGHSMGGAMAARYAYLNQDQLAGAIIWDSYPPESDSLADSSLPVWHIHRATPDGKPPEKFAVMRHLYPASSTWVPVPGGIHMYFGSFDGGGYVEQWEPRISREAQHDIVVTATLNALQAMTGG
jgi:pimeloyl-ACP methyl ester carboxylesterase